MTPNSSAAHVDEWLADYRARMMAAVAKRPKPEGLDDEPDGGEIAVICPIPAR
jgi:hypothetical protein